MNACLNSAFNKLIGTYVVSLRSASKGSPIFAPKRFAFSRVWVGLGQEIPDEPLRTALQDWCSAQPKAANAGLW